MSLLAAEYGEGSSSDDDCAPPRGTAFDEKAVDATIHKSKKILHLHPHIQRLLELGKTASSDEELDDMALIEQQKRLQTRRKRKNDTANPLDFLPKPVNTCEEAAQQDIPVDTVEHARYPEDKTVGSAQAYAANTNYKSEPCGKDTLDMRKRARIKARLMEQALERGELEALDPSLAIKDVQGPAPGDWKPSVEMLEAVKGEAIEVAASYWNSRLGGKVSSGKPTRLQRHKHQLNQLAFDAQAREQELLNRKGIAIKTKAETQAKYGW